MSRPPDSAPPRRAYGCTDYREEMRLLALRRQLEESALAPEARREIERLVAELEAKMGM